MILLDGKKIALSKTQELKKHIIDNKLDIKFAIIQVGNIFESNKYIEHKIKKAKEIGISPSHIKLEDNIEELELIKEIKNVIPKYDALIIQLPLPSHINKQKILDLIPLEKDVDGLSTKNMENFYNDKDDFFVPATAKGILMLLESYNINLKDKKIMIIGESNLVGKPIKKLLSKYTNKLESRNKHTGILGSQEFEILIVAAGKPKLVKKDNVKKGAVIIDVGINTLDNNKIIGDVDFDDVKNKIYAISPSPGGVGPMTVISLMENIIATKKNKY